MWKRYEDRYFKTDFFEAISGGVREVFEVGSDWAIVKIIEQYRTDVPIEAAHARGY